MKEYDIDEIIRLIDGEMANGSGHVNLKIDKSKNGVFIESSAEAACENAACQIPTLHEGLD